MDKIELLYWFQVTNPRTKDRDRIGYLERKLTRADDPDLGETFVIHFEDGDETPYFADEIECVFVC